MADRGGVKATIRAGGGLALLIVLLTATGCALDDLQYGPLRPRTCGQAIDSISLQMRERPPNAGLLDERAAAYECNKQYDLALNDLNEAARLYPGSYEYDLRGQAYVLSGKPELAIADFDRALLADPQDARAYLHLGAIYAFQGDVELAKRDFHKALALGGGDWTILNGYAWCVAVSPTRQMQNGKAAVRYATQACELTAWANAYALDTLAAAYARDAQFDEAVKWQKEALRLADRQKADSMKRRLALYQSGEPFTQTTLIPA